MRRFADSAASDRLTIMVGVLLTVLCLAYFYMLDRVIFSSLRFTPIFQLLLAVYDPQSAGLAVLLCLVAALWTRSAPIHSLADRLGRHAVAASAASVALLACGAIFVYHDYPLAMDEYAPVFQSKVFAMGHIAAQFPARLIPWLIAPGFNGMFMIASPWRRISTGQGL